MPGVVKSNATRIWEVNVHWPVYSQCCIWDPRGRGVDIWECIRDHDSKPGTEVPTQLFILEIRSTKIAGLLPLPPDYGNTLVTLTTISSEYHNITYAASSHYLCAPVTARYRPARHLRAAPLAVFPVVGSQHCILAYPHERPYTGHATRTYAEVDIITKSPPTHSYRWPGAVTVAMEEGVLYSGPTITSIVSRPCSPLP